MSLHSTMSLALIAMLLVIGALASVLAYEVALGEAGQFMDDQMRQLASIVNERTRPGAIGALQEPEDRFAVTIWTGDDQGLVLSPPAAAAPRHDRVSRLLHRLCGRMASPSAEDPRQPETDVPIKAAPVRSRSAEELPLLVDGVRHRRRSSLALGAL